MPKFNQYKDESWAAATASGSQWSASASNFGIASLVKSSLTVSSSCKSLDCINTAFAGMDWTWQLAIMQSGMGIPLVPLDTIFMLSKFSTANDLKGLTGATCCQPQDSSTSYGSCATLSFSSTVKSWPECPDNYLLTGIRRKRQSSTLDDIDGFHCCTPPSNAIPKVVPEYRNKVGQFGRNVEGAI